MEAEQSKFYSINQWADEDRPREKLMQKGRHVLSDAELIAILLGSGTRSLSAVDLARQLLLKADNDLNALGKMGVNDLKKCKGIGEAKAISIISALELGRRRKEQEKPKQVQISSSLDAYELMRPHLTDLEVEEFWVILLSRANKVLSVRPVSKGGVSGTVADPKVIFKEALDLLASAIILVHNHPSGNLRPSNADISLTKKLKEAGNFLELPILDHLIFADEGYYSFADEGML